MLWDYAQFATFYSRQGVDLRRRIKTGPSSDLLL